MGRSKRCLVGLLALGALWLPMSAYSEPEPDAAPPATPAAPPPAGTLDGAAELRREANAELSETQSQV